MQLAVKETLVRSIGSIHRGYDMKRWLDPVYQTGEGASIVDGQVLVLVKAYRMKSAESVIERVLKDLHKVRIPKSYNLARTILITRVSEAKKYKRLLGSKVKAKRDEAMSVLRARGLTKGESNGDTKGKQTKR